MGKVKYTYREGSEQLASIMMRRGHPEEALARALEIPLSQIWAWKVRFPEFRDAIARGRTTAIAAGLRPDLDYDLPRRERRRRVDWLRTQDKPSDAFLERLEELLVEDRPGTPRNPMLQMMLDTCARQYAGPPRTKKPLTNKQRAFKAFVHSNYG